MRTEKRGTNIVFLHVLLPVPWSTLPVSCLVIFILVHCMLQDLDHQSQKLGLCSQADDIVLASDVAFQQKQTVTAVRSRPYPDIPHTCADGPLHNTQSCQWCCATTQPVPTVMAASFDMGPKLSCQRSGFLIGHLGRCTQVDQIACIGNDSCQGVDYVVQIHVCIFLH